MTAEELIEALEQVMFDDQYLLPHQSKKVIAIVEEYHQSKLPTEEEIRTILDKEIKLAYNLRTEEENIEGRDEATKSILKLMKV